MTETTGSDALARRARHLLGRMTLEEKIGQMNQLDASGGVLSEPLHAAIAAGRVGSVLNATDAGLIGDMQRIAREQSRLGIPLLVGRDVIHGYETVMPIPLGQAATWNPRIVREGARVAAREASAVGINWTFAPMLDIARDARWGRIAESPGEDPVLAGRFAAATVAGLQGEDLADETTVAACAKHFAAYGATEAGRDYDTTNVPENELRNVYLRPFRAAIEAGAATVMTSFSENDGVPGTANAFLLRQVLREEWGFDGAVVSDWDSVRQLRIHGLTANDRDSAFEAAAAGVNVEMHGGAYIAHLASLVRDGRLPEATIDRLVLDILRLKLRMNLFEPARTAPVHGASADRAAHLEVAAEAARQSLVLLKNDHAALPLEADELASVALIGPLADAPAEQLGTWVFDGDPSLSVTPLAAIRAQLGTGAAVHHVRALPNTRSRDTDGIDEAVAVARRCDAAVLFVGEDAILSGEAHCRADIDLPGAQMALVRRVREACGRVVAVILAGRPLTLASVLEHVDALIYAWHPGTMAGPAIADVLFGRVSPSGRLPVSFPRLVGQIPIHYNRKNTGKPPSPETVVHIDQIPEAATQTSFGMTAFHLDAGFTPLFPFGFGLSYTRFEYRDLRLSEALIRPDQTLTVSVELANAGPVAADEVVQLYVRDLVGSVTRPVRELKDFRRVHLRPGESVRVEFELSVEDLSFYRRDQSWGAEPGEFRVWVGGSSQATLEGGFALSD